MAPPQRAKQESPSVAVAGPSRGRPSNKPRNHPYPKNSNDQDALPGVQKLKSAVRQTKRLLAKNRLAADVRVETERRLKVLETDLAHAEQSRKERHYATKYHKVRFFERQKLVRKINQIKRGIAASEEKERKKLDSTLTCLRVDLNYVLHFPRTKKYVSLFPPEVRKSGSAAVPIVASLDDNEERSKWRDAIRQQMERGELSTEPENELGKFGQYKRLTSWRRGVDAVPGSIHTVGVAGDNFFGDDDEEDSQDSEASDS